MNGIVGFCTVLGLRLSICLDLNQVMQRYLSAMQFLVCHSPSCAHLVVSLVSYLISMRHRYAMKGDFWWCIIQGRLTVKTNLL